MEFEQFSNIICKQIGIPATASYGSVGMNYLKVIAFQDGKFVELGELLYRIWRETLYTKAQLIAFGKECEDYRLGFRKTMPTWRYKDDILTFHD